MTRLERLAVLTLLVVLLLVLIAMRPLFGLVGAVGGIVAGLSLAQRLEHVRVKVDARLGEDPPPGGGFRRDVVVRRGLTQLGVLLVLFLLTAPFPFIGTRVFIAVAAAATAVPAILTAQGLLPRRWRR